MDDGAQGPCRDPGHEGRAALTVAVAGDLGWVPQGVMSGRSGCLSSDLWGGHWGPRLGGWEATNASSRPSFPPVSPERYSYGTSGSSSKRTEGSCARRRQSSSSSESQQGQWETGERSGLGTVLASLSSWCVLMDFPDLAHRAWPEGSFCLILEAACTCCVCLSLPRNPVSRSDRLSSFTGFPTLFSGITLWVSLHSCVCWMPF